MRLATPRSALPPSGAVPSSADRAAAAGTWRLGDRTVNRLGFGAMRLTGTRPFHDGVPRDRDTSIAVLRRAVELGVDHLDTAAFYFSRTRSANELINAALAPYPDELTIVTKVGPVRDLHGQWADRPGPGGLRGHVEENLRQLGRDRLDVVNFRTGRDPDIAPYVAALAELVDEGLVGHIGVSGVSLDQLEAARAVTDVVCVQNRLSVDSPADQALLRRCGELGIAFVPFFTVSGAAGAGRPGEEPPRCGRWPQSWTRPRPRSGWPGRWRSGSTSWSSQAPAASSTSRRTSVRRGCASPTDQVVRLAA